MPERTIASPVELVPPSSRPLWWVLGATALVAAELVYRWSFAWRSAPDFAHGWLVPVFALYAAWERRLDCPSPTRRSSLSAVAVFRLAAFVAVGWGGMRLLLEPFPTWPSALWVYSGFGWASLLGLIWAVYGRPTARHFAFPVLFTATALPWPTWLDLEVIIPLRTFLAAVAAEVIHALGYPALPHGTVIEVGLGQVGIDEACSGVRSLQSAVMVSLLLGEVFRLTWTRRLLLLGGGMLLAIATNLGRTCWLAWQGATRGVAGVDAWHDTAGVVQMSLTLGGMALIGWRWRIHAQPDRPREPSGETASLQIARAGALLLAATILLLESGTQLWFASASTSATTSWSAELPRTLPSFRTVPVTPAVRDILQTDREQIGEWTTKEGGRRAGYILEWDKGSIARQTIALHNPEVCLPGNGQVFIGDRGMISIPTASGTPLAFRVSEFSGPLGRFYVFYLAWDVTHHRALLPADDSTLRLWFQNRFAEVKGRRKSFEARVLALAFYDSGSVENAFRMFHSEVSSLVNATDAGPL